MNKKIIAIDPGSAGAIAWLGSNGKVAVENMPDTPMDILCLLKEIAFEGMAESEYNTNAVCYLEDVGHGMPNQSSKATASFARHNGHLEMALLALGVKTVKVLPTKWQKTLGIGNSKGCADKREWKIKLKAKCQELFPDKKVTLANADALLILDYAIKQEK